MNPYHRLRGSIADSHRTGVGASDIPTLALLNLRYGSTPYSLWRVDTGRDPPWTGNDKTWWGNQHENTVLYRWVLDNFDAETAARFLAGKLRGRSTGALKVLTEFRHPRYRFAIAHPDLLVDHDEPVIVQAKSSGYHAARRKPDPDYGYDPEDRTQNGLPAAVFLQEQWELFCAGLEAPAWVALLADTNNYAAYGPVVADPRTQEKCLALAERFWWHVEHDQEPKPETWADVRGMFPEVAQTTAMVSGDAELSARQMVERKARIDAAVKRLHGRLDDMKNAMGLLIGGNAVLATSEGEVLAKAREAERWNLKDAKKLETQEPALWAALKEKGFVSRSTWRELRY